MSLLAEIQSGEIARTVIAQQHTLDPIRQFILDHFGQTGLYAAYLLAAAIVLLLAYKLVKFSFQLIFFVALPSLLAAFIATFFLPYSFVYMLPATVSLFTLGLVLRSVAFSKG
jgi:hypothetical protein